MPNDWNTKVLAPYFYGCFIAGFFTLSAHRVQIQNRGRDYARSTGFSNLIHVDCSRRRGAPLNIAAVLRPMSDHAGPLRRQRRLRTLRRGGRWVRARLRSERSGQENSEILQRRGGLHVNATWEGCANPDATSSTRILRFSCIVGQWADGMITPSLCCSMLRNNVILFMLGLALVPTSLGALARLKPQLMLYQFGGLELATVWRYVCVTL